MTRRATGYLLGSSLIAVLAVLTITGCSTPAAVAHPTSTAAVQSASPVPPGQLLFRRYTDADQTTAALFVSDTDGTHERQIVPPTPGRAQQGQNWSDDGTKVVFTSRTTGDGAEAYQLFTSAADGSGLRALTPGRPAHGTTVPGFDDDPAFSPDGSTIAYVHSGGVIKNDELEHSDLFLMRADGSGAHSITHYAAYSGDSGGPAWSPDGKQLVVARFDAVGNRTALFVLDADGSHSRQLTDWKVGANGLLDWSSQGDLIAFRVADEESGVGNFFAIRADGTGLRQITHFTGRKVGHKIAFSPDGTWVTFAAADKDGVNDIYVSKVDGSSLHLVKHTPLEENGPAWAPANG